VQTHKPTSLRSCRPTAMAVIIVLHQTERPAFRGEFQRHAPGRAGADPPRYFGVLMTTGRSLHRGLPGWCASAVEPGTRRLRYCVAVRPGTDSRQSVAARRTVSAGPGHNGRLMVNASPAAISWSPENKGDGIFLGHDERYAVTREFLNVI